jgi:hypothetical protein
MDELSAIDDAHDETGQRVLPGEGRRGGVDFSKHRRIIASPGSGRPQIACRAKRAPCTMPHREETMKAAADRLLGDAIDRGDVPGVVAMATDTRGATYEAAYGKRDARRSRPR